MNKNTTKENNLERNNQKKLPQLQQLNLSQLDGVVGGMNRFEELKIFNSSADSETFSR